MNNEHVTVTQADRDRFEELFLFGVGPVARSMLEDGAWDNDYRMQGLARHRIEATANVEPDTQALLREAREALEPFALQTALAHAGKMETMRIRLPLEVFDAARAFLTKLDAFLKGDPNVGRS